jgi:hypothetical protein
MDFIYFILAFSFIYLVLLRAVMLKLGLKESNKMRERLSELDKQFSEASKKGNSKEMERLNAEKIPISMQMMNMQLKMMLPMLILFFAMVMVLNAMNPQIADDVFVKNVSMVNRTFATSNPSMEAFKIAGRDTSNVSFTGYIYMSRERGIYTNLTPGYTIYPIIKGSGNYGIYPVEQNGEISLTAENVTQFESVEFDSGTESNLFVPLDIIGIRFVYGAQGLFIFLGFVLGMVEQLFMGKALNNAIEKAMERLEGKGKGEGK